jgi:hypothetical protein
MKRLSAVLLLCVFAPAPAQEDSDLDRIPSTVGQPAPLPNREPIVVADIRAAPSRYFVEDVFTYASFQQTVAVPSSSKNLDWADRISFDTQTGWFLNGRDTLALHVSDRLSVTAGEGVSFPREALRNDLREAYVTWDAPDDAYLEAGRINLRSGVALGYNPTDFFRSRTAVATASADPSNARENRLGTTMIRGQKLWDFGSLVVAYAPRLTARTPLWAGSRDGFGPHFDFTNADHRFFVSFDLSSVALNPQISLYHAGGRTKAGLNFSYPLGQSVIAYAEWSGGKAPNLIADAIAYGKATSTLPAFVPALPPTGSGRAFQNDVAAGASWTGTDKITINLEYHYSSAAMSGRDWRNWFAIGEASPSSAGELWYVRGYASAMQVPASRHRIFLRADWQDAFVVNLDIGAIAFVNPRDGSGMAQVYAGYDISDHWSVSGYVSGYFGGSRTEWGSMAGTASYSIRLARYL